MGLQAGLQRVLSDYRAACKEDFAKHPMASFIRGDLRDAAASAFKEHEELSFKGSAGQGTWARGPWVGIFHKLVTSGAQSGYYPVYLFREDMTGVYLSLNQGMTAARQLYKSDAKTALISRAANFRAMLGPDVGSFNEKNIDLRPSDQKNDTVYYEYGNICAKFYPADNIPNDSELISDLQDLIDIYQILIQGETKSEISGITNEGDEPPDISIEDATRFRMHKRIERNSKLVKDVKKYHGYSCQVCQINFEKIYGDIGREYIEAHHLKPIASLKGQRVAMDPAKDFVVLCANCHRMVHRSGYVDNIEEFKKVHYHG